MSDIQNFDNIEEPDFKDLSIRHEELKSQYTDEVKKKLLARLKANFEVRVRLRFF